MKKIASILFDDGITITGFVLITLSGLLFVASGLVTHQSTAGFFFTNYVLAWVYLILVFVGTFRRHRWHLSAGKIEHTILLLILWFISAFALNREMNVFDSSVTWLCVWIVLSGTALLIAAYHRFLPAVFKYFVFLVLGGAVSMFTYYVFYLVPLYLISAVGIIVLGLSLHTFVPFFLALVSTTLIIKAARHNRKIIYFAVAGFLLPILLCVVFLAKWASINNQINLIINQNVLNPTQLPAWVQVSQRLKKSMVLERVLKTGLVYHDVEVNDNFFWGGMPHQSFDEPKQHDPLVVIATLLYKKPNLDEGDRVKILRSMYDGRHQAQDRLWSGDALETVSVISNVKLFPEYRMAYTEKTLSIRNNSRSTWSKGEAIYTFHLSEGSVVSSLSLWINGTEEKSRLTTKAKADSAYRQVVGVESHDPSVVHWQEGNTVSVRVFPCGISENRMFKLGITSPLQKVKDRLVYENPYFDGPQATAALETIQLSFSAQPSDLVLPAGLEQTSTGVYHADRNYQPGWNISCVAPPLAHTVFSFAGSAYAVRDYQPIYENFSPQTIYLDLNSAWTQQDFNSVWEKVKNKNVYVYTDRLTRLTAENKANIYELMAKQNFSLLPIQQIADAEKALIITKSNGNAPNLYDLDGSEFSKSLTRCLKQTKSIRMYNIGPELTPYLKALKEFRILNCDNGTVDELATLLAESRSVKSQENDSTVVISSAQMAIQKTNALQTQAAPNHLLRLFAYNDVMKKMGSSYFSNDYIQPDLIAEAEQAYIASPVSSLIVLETLKDYERFGIDESKNSLKNASLKSSGSVPEPSEWLLIIIALAAMGWLIYKPKFSLKNL